jgi:hypothetical protein
MRDSALVPYAQSLMRPLAEAMYEKLPQELRDYVYGYLWGTTYTAYYHESSEMWEIEEDNTLGILCRRSRG